MTSPSTTASKSLGGERRGEEVLGAHVEPERVARVVRGERRRLDADGLPAGGPRLVEQEADPAAEVEQPPRRRGHVLDARSSDAPRRLALSRLLVDVVRGRGLVVRLAELRVARHRGELHVPAARAADDVAEGGAEPVGRGDEPAAPASPRPAGAASSASAPQAAHRDDGSIGGNVANTIRAVRREGTELARRATGQRRRAHATTRRAPRASFYSRVCAALGDVPSSSSSSTTARRTRTPAILARSPTADPRVKVVELARNFGHQTALTAGLDHARGDAVVMIDADLQDPPELIPEMLERWRDGRRRRLRRPRPSARARPASSSRPRGSSTA